MKSEIKSLKLVFLNKDKTKRLNLTKSKFSVTYGYTQRHSNIYSKEDCKMEI